MFFAKLVKRLGSKASVAFPWKKIQSKGSRARARSFRLNFLSRERDACFTSKPFYKFCKEHKSPNHSALRQLFAKATPPMNCSPPQCIAFKAPLPFVLDSNQSLVKAAFLRGFFIYLFWKSIKINEKWPSNQLSSFKGDRLLVTSSLICGYGRQMALTFLFKSGFYCNFGRPIRFRGQMDARTPSGAENWGLSGFWGLFVQFLLNYCPDSATFWHY